MWLIYEGNACDLKGGSACDVVGMIGMQSEMGDGMAECGAMIMSCG